MRPKKSHILKLTALTIRETIVCSFFFLILIVSCKNEKPDKIGAVVDRTKLPKLHETEVSTIISDSGITRYRISAPRWDIYDKAIQPYQEFPEGIYFEKFDLNLKVDANIQSNYARFNDTQQIWLLKGKVRAMNLQGELFETEQLYWDQRQARFYSDSLIKITQTTRIITGIGFESNETMTHYLIKNPKGTFPLNENAKPSTSSAQPTVTTSAPKPPIVPVTAPPKASVVPIPFRKNANVNHVAKKK